MSRLFAELYIDEDVSALLTKLLRSRGFVVTSAQEAGMLGCSDKEQLAHAVSQRKALLTHNRVHFEALVRHYYATGRTHSGVIIVVRRSPYEILQRLLRLLDQLTADEMENQIYYI
jgi:hypothetical protein